MILRISFLFLPVLIGVVIGSSNDGIVTAGVNDNVAVGVEAAGVVGNKRDPGAVNSVVPVAALAEGGVEGGGGVGGPGVAAVAAAVRVDRGIPASVVGCAALTLLYNACKSGIVALTGSGIPALVKTFISSCLFLYFLADKCGKCDVLAELAGVDGAAGNDVDGAAGNDVVGGAVAAAAAPDGAGEKKTDFGVGTVAGRVVLGPGVNGVAGIGKPLSLA